MKAGQWVAGCALWGYDGEIARTSLDCRGDSIPLGAPHDFVKVWAADPLHALLCLSSGGQWGCCAARPGCKVESTCSNPRKEQQCKTTPALRCAHVTIRYVVAAGRVEKAQRAQHGALGYGSCTASLTRKRAAARVAQLAQLGMHCTGRACMTPSMLSRWGRAPLARPSAPRTVSTPRCPKVDLEVRRTLQCFAARPYHA